MTADATTRADMVQAALARGDAHERLDRLLAIDTSNMSREELAKHREAIAVAVSDKALGA